MQEDRPLPKPDSITSPFWDGTRNGELRLQICLECKQFNWYPKSWCSKCGSDRLSWQKVSGRGIVYSFAVVRDAIRGFPKGLTGLLPIILAEIDLEEGVRIYSNVINCKPEDVQIGMKVKVWFEASSQEIWLPKFEPDVD